MLRQPLLPLRFLLRSSRRSPPSQRSMSKSDRASNLVLFGLSEASSLVETKKVIDEILEFLSGKPIQIRDMFYLGKYVQPTSSLPRLHPVLIKLCTARDRRLVLFRRSGDFRIKHLFLREDVPPDHRLRSGRSNPSAQSLLPTVSVQSSLASSTDAVSASAGSSHSVPQTQACCSSLAASVPNNKHSVSPCPREVPLHCSQPLLPGAPCLGLLFHFNCSSG